MKLFSILLLSLLFVVTDTYAKELTLDKNEPETITKEIKRENGQLYHIIITLPSDYQPEKEYKILYYLDAYWLNELIEGCYRIQSLSNKSFSENMDELILVGISSVGDVDAWNRQRNMDFTPSKYNLNIKMNFGEVPLDETTTGGAEEFMIFFKNHIINTVESEYKADSSSRSLLGHSFGGLLGFYSFLNHNELFSNYILISPSVWWNNSEIFISKESLLSKSDVNMFITVGTAEFNLLKKPLAELIEELKLQSSGNLNLTYKQYENANHNSVLPQSIYDGIEWLITKSK